MSQLEDSRKILEDALETLDKQDFYERLAFHERTLETHVTVERDSGSKEVFKAFRSQHSTLRGPGKGGIRFSEDVSE